MSSGVTAAMTPCALLWVDSSLSTLQQLTSGEKRIEGLGLRYQSVGFKGWRFELRAQNLDESDTFLTVSACARRRLTLKKRAHNLDEVCVRVEVRERRPLRAKGPRLFRKRLTFFAK